VFFQRDELDRCVNGVADDVRHIIWRKSAVSAARHAILRSRITRVDSVRGGRAERHLAHAFHQHAVRYTDLAPSFVFAAAQTSTGSVTISAALLGARNAYKWNGSQACGSGDIIAGNVYRATPLQALNGGSGGFVVDSVGNNNALTDIELIINGGGVAVTTGQKGQVHVPFDATIINWRVMADQSGSIVIDVLRAQQAVPVTSMIGAGNKPTLTASQFAQQNVSGWTSVIINANDWLAFNVTSAATATMVTVVLGLVKL